VSTPFRCSAASAERGEPALGSASTVRSFLLVEAPGSWGVEALRDSRLPSGVRDWLTRLRGVRPLLVRQHHRRRRDGGPLRVFAAFADATRPWLETATLDTPDDVMDLDVGALGEGRSAGLTPHDELLYLVCTHGRHDACCAERGRPLCAAMQEAAPGRAWEVSHIGGDRFAANMLVFPHGLYYGRLRPEHAGPLVAAHEQGSLDLDHLRGRSSYPFAVQAAEIYLRRHLGLLGFTEVTLLGHDRTGALTRSAWHAGGGRWRVTVATVRGERHLLTCRSVSESSGLRQDLVSVEEEGA